MGRRHARLTVIAGLLLVVLAAGRAVGAGKSPVTVPEGTTIITVKYGDDGTEAPLKPEEQVAFLFVYGIWGLEGECMEDPEVGRLCQIAELVKGMKGQGGRIIGLSLDPRKDTNYNYDMTIVGADCLIRAVPRIAGLGAFGLAGSPRRGIGNFYYNPAGPDLVRGTVKLTEYGFDGSGFRR